MQRNFIGLSVFGLLLVSGCGDSTVPDESSKTRPAASATLSTIRIHIDGFKKSKSGAT